MFGLSLSRGPIGISNTPWRRGVLLDMITMTATGFTETPILIFHLATHLDCVPALQLNKDQPPPS